MIRYKVAARELDRRIRAKKASWFDDAELVMNALPDPPQSADFKPLWSA